MYTNNQVVIIAIIYKLKRRITGDDLSLYFIFYWNFIYLHVILYPISELGDKSAEDRSNADYS
jgi:hypothetical protein